MNSTKINVLYISYDGMTDPLGQSQVLPYLMHLSKHFKFHLISFEKPHIFAQHEDTIREICKESNIEWHPLSYTKRPPVLSTVYDVRKMFKLAKALDDKNDFKIIHCRSYISAFVGLSFQKKRQKKFIFDMRGFWADERVEGGIWNLKNPIYRFVYKFFKRKEIQYFENSDAIVSLTENGKSEILSWNLKNVTEKKITVIPCCVNLDLFNPNSIKENEINQLKQELGIQKADYILGYIGSIGTWYMLPEMLDYFKVLVGQNPQSKFLFVTGESPDVIIKQAKEKGIDTDKIMVRKCLHKEVPKYISLFNQSVFFIQPVYSKKASSPTKQGELMAMGIPVVCNSGVGDSDFVINSFHSGVLVHQFNEVAYQESIDTFNQTDFNLKDIEEGAKQFFGLEQGAESYLSIYKGLIG